MGHHMQITSAAYHEAAHAVIAAVLGLPLMRTGIHIDTLGHGVLFLSHRDPGDPSNTAEDKIHRERTIVELKAGRIAQCKVWSNCDPVRFLPDEGAEFLLLKEMYGEDKEALRRADAVLTVRSEELVGQHWRAIEGVANALLRKPIQATGTFTRAECDAMGEYEMWMDGFELAETLGQFGLLPIVRDES